MTRTEHLPVSGRRHRSSAVATAAAAAAIAALWSGPPAAAHTGRAAASVADGLSHPILGLDHLLAMFAVGVIAACVGGGRRAWLTPIGFVLGMVAGGFVGMMAGEVASVEIAIAISVVVLGLGVGALNRESGWWLPASAVVLGALHGHAHGAELPSGAVPVLYVAGFVAMTAALHLGGAGAGLLLRRVPAARLAAGGLIALGGVALAFGG